MFRRVLQDVLFVMMIGFVMMVALMLPYLNPPAVDDESEPPGNVIAAIEWPPGNTDVDMWVMGPGEVAPVGYSNKSGRLWNLLRDDLGTYPDVTPSNYENAYTRGITPGEYIINVHCYRCPVLPTVVEVEVSVRAGNLSGGKTPLKIIVTTQVILTKGKQELTAIRFELDADGKVVPDSMNHVYRRLRAPIMGMSGRGV